MTHAEMSTKEKLALALIAAGAPTAMIAAARAGRYDDFDSPSATPINDLIRDASKHAGLEDIIRRAMLGQFDATKAEANAWWAREGRDLLEGGN